MKNDDLCLICGKQREPGLEPLVLKWSDDNGRHSMDIKLCQDCLDDLERAAYEVADRQEKDRSPWMRKKTQKNFWKMKQRQGGSP